MENGLVSVIMPCYNDGAYIRESVASVYAQTYPEVELVIVDDGSQDPGTVEALRSLETKARCRVLRMAHAGLAAARNFGIENAKGTYILPLDSDDTIDPTYIEKAVAILREKPEVGVVYCRADLFGEVSGPWDLPDYSLKRMLRDNIVFATALFYKEDWATIGGYNPNMIYGLEDYDFWIGILELGREIYQIPEILFHYRKKKRSMTTSMQESVEHVKQMYGQIYDNHPDFYQKYREEYAKELRALVVEQEFAIQNILKKAGIIGKIARHPRIKPFVKAFIGKKT